MNLEQNIQTIADHVEHLADKYFEHPDRVARIHSVMMSIDAEIFERMKKAGGLNDQSRTH